MQFSPHRFFIGISNFVTWLRFDNLKEKLTGKHENLLHKRNAKSSQYCRRTQETSDLESTGNLNTM